MGVLPLSLPLNGRWLRYAGAAIAAGFAIVLLRDAGTPVILALADDPVEGYGSQALLHFWRVLRNPSEVQYIEGMSALLILNRTLGALRSDPRLPRQLFRAIRLGMLLLLLVPCVRVTEVWVGHYGIGFDPFRARSGTMFADGVYSNEEIHFHGHFQTMYRW